MSKESSQGQDKGKKRRTRIPQTAVPGASLEDALKIANALFEQYAGESASPLKVAKALGVQPTSGPFRTLCGASAAYGLTVGGYNTEKIETTDLSRRILRPTNEGDDELARVEALLSPRVIGEFLRKYHGSPLPREDIAKNVLDEMGVPRDRVDDVFSIIVEGASAVGVIAEIGEKRYVDLDLDDSVPTQSTEPDQEIAPVQTDAEPSSPTQPTMTSSPASATLSATDSRDPKKVFIAHGKNQKFVDPIIKLLEFGEMVAVVSVKKASVSQPVPDKVISEMRDCGGAIIHVNAEQTVVDKNDDEHIILNPNVLIEIGASLALHGRRLILLVQDGVKLPSDLQGLFEVRYSGETLDGNATIKLLEAINDLKKHDLPRH